MLLKMFLSYNGKSFGSHISPQPPGLGLKFKYEWAGTETCHTPAVPIQNKHFLIAESLTKDLLSIYRK
jgi:hypothetical protein